LTFIGLDLYLGSNESFYPYGTVQIFHSWCLEIDLCANGDDKFYLLDVRNPHEQEITLIPGTDLLIPVTE
jgi:hypothetical protein